MAAPEPVTAPPFVTTTVSAKGQIVLPSATRVRKDWPPGTRLIVEETLDGVLLKPAPILAPIFAPTTVENVRGMLAYIGPAQTIEEMDAGVLEEARRHDGGD